MFWDRISFLLNFQNITVITCPIYCIGRHAISNPTSDQPDLKNVVLTKVIFFVASKLARPSLTFPDDSHKSQSTIIDSCCRHSKKIMHRKDACVYIFQVESLEAKYGNWIYFILSNLSYEVLWDKNQAKWLNKIRRDLGGMPVCEAGWGRHHMNIRRIKILSGKKKKKILSNWWTWPHQTLDVSCKLVDDACIACKIIWHERRTDRTFLPNWRGNEQYGPQKSMELCVRTSECL